jgi:hypothetical protein
MSTKRSALKPSECENVTDKSKIKVRSSTRDFIRDEKPLHYTTVKKKKKSVQGPYSQGYKNLRTGLQTYQNK